MLARGRLLGLLLLGIRTSGEAYVAGEIDATRELGHGVGAALDALEHTAAEPARDISMLQELRALRAATEQNAKGFAALIAMLNERANT